MNRCYGGYLKDLQIHGQAASGGMATGMAQQMLQKSGVVYGVVFAKDFRQVHWLRATEAGQLMLLQGSKYVKSEPTLGVDGGSVYSAVIQDLRSDTPVLFIGLPCEVGVLRHRCEKEAVDTQKLLTVDLICQGPPDSGVLNAFVEGLEKKYHSRVVQMSMRYKKDAQDTPYMYVVFDNGKEYLEKLQKTQFWTAFNQMPMLSCYQCRFKGEGHLSDVTIGDHWALTPDSPEYHPLGVSVAFVHSAKGDRFLQACQTLHLFDTDADQARKANPRYDTSVRRWKQNDVFRANFQKGGLNYACRKHNTLRRSVSKWIPKSLVEKIKRLIRR